MVNMVDVGCRICLYTQSVNIGSPPIRYQDNRSPQIVIQDLFGNGTLQCDGLWPYATEI